MSKAGGPVTWPGRQMAVLCLCPRRLSSTSKSGATVASIAVRKSRNSVARCRLWHVPRQYRRRLRKLQTTSLCHAEHKNACAVHGRQTSSATVAACLDLAILGHTGNQRPIVSTSRVCHCSITHEEAEQCSVRSKMTRTPSQASTGAD